MEQTIFATEAQQKVIDSTATVKFVSAAAGSGSSFLSMFLAAEHDGDVTVVMPDVKFIGMPGGDEHIQRVLCKQHGYTLKRQERVAVHPSGKKVRFVQHAPETIYSASCVICEQAHQLPRNFMRYVPLHKDKKVVILSGATEDLTHPCYKMAKETLLQGKNFITGVDGFPYFAKERKSLQDVFGVSGVDIQGFRMYLEDNQYLLRNAPQYKQLLESQPYKERMKFQGKWLFDL